MSLIGKTISTFTDITNFTKDYSILALRLKSISSYIPDLSRIINEAGTISRIITTRGTLLVNLDNVKFRKFGEIIQVESGKIDDLTINVTKFDETKGTPLIGSYTKNNITTQFDFTRIDDLGKPVNGKITTIDAASVAKNTEFIDVARNSDGIPTDGFLKANDDIVGFTSFNNQLFENTTVVSKTQLNTVADDLSVVTEQTRTYDAGKTVDVPRQDVDDALKVVDESKIALDVAITANKPLTTLRQLFNKFVDALGNLKKKLQDWRAARQAKATETTPLLNKLDDIDLKKINDDDMTQTTKSLKQKVFDSMSEYLSKIKSSKDEIEKQKKILDNAYEDAFAEFNKKYIKIISTDATKNQRIIDFLVLKNYIQNGGYVKGLAPKEMPPGLKGIDNIESTNLTVSIKPRITGKGIKVKVEGPSIFKRHPRITKYTAISLLLASGAVATILAVPGSPENSGGIKQEIEQEQNTFIECIKNNPYAFIINNCSVEQICSVSPVNQDWADAIISDIKEYVQCIKSGSSSCNSVQLSSTVSPAIDVIRKRLTESFDPSNEKESLAVLVDEIAKVNEESKPQVVYTSPFMPVPDVADDYITDMFFVIGPKASLVINLLWILVLILIITICYYILHAFVKKRKN